MWAFIFNLILDLCYYLPLEKSVALHLNELEAPPSKDALIVSCLVKNWPSGSGEKIFKYFQYNFTFLLLSPLGEGWHHFAFKSLLRKVLSFMWTKCFVPSNWLKLIHNIFFKLSTFLLKCRRLLDHQTHKTSLIDILMYSLRVSMKLLQVYEQTI